MIVALSRLRNRVDNWFYFPLSGLVQSKRLVLFFPVPNQIEGESFQDLVDLFQWFICFCIKNTDLLNYSAI